MDNTLFMNACNTVIYNAKVEDSIGTLSEKTIHAVIKHYLCSDTSYHEIKVNNYYADIFVDNSVIEIQSRNFDKLRNKLDLFLTMYPVTVVYPIPYEKWLRWINDETGEISPPRKSPKKGTPYMIFQELYRIKTYLTNDNLRLKILLINVEEYRYLNGWSKDKKKGSKRCDGLPLELIDEITITNIKEFDKLIPKNLPDEFTTKDFKKASGLSVRGATTAVHVLHYIGSIKRIGKERNAYIYTK